MADMTAVTRELVDLARRLVEMYDSGAAHFDSFDIDLAEFRSKAASLLAEDAVALARAFCKRAGPDQS